MPLVLRGPGIPAGRVRSEAVSLVDVAPTLLALAGLPSFVAEAKFSGDAFRLFRRRSPETRMQRYLDKHRAALAEAPSKAETMRFLAVLEPDRRRRHALWRAVQARRGG